MISWQDFNLSAGGHTFECMRALCTSSQSVLLRAHEWLFELRCSAAGLWGDISDRRRSCREVEDWHTALSSDDLRFDSDSLNQRYLLLGWFCLVVVRMPAGRFLLKTRCHASKPTSFLNLFPTLPYFVLSLPSNSLGRSMFYDRQFKAQASFRSFVRQTTPSIIKNSVQTRT